MRLEGGKRGKNLQKYRGLLRGSEGFPGFDGVAGGLAGGGWRVAGGVSGEVGGGRVPRGMYPSVQPYGQGLVWPPWVHRPAA